MPTVLVALGLLVELQWLKSSKGLKSSNYTSFTWCAGVMITKLRIEHSSRGNVFMGVSEH